MTRPARLLAVPFAVAVVLLLAAAPRASLASWGHDVANPTTVCPGPNDNTTPGYSMLADGAGGFYVAFSSAIYGVSSQLMLERITSTGAVAGGWPAGGVALSTASLNGGQAARLFPDGTGGLYAVWLDYRNSRTDVFAQRLTGAGAIQAGWPVGGLNVSTDAVEHFNFSACSDGATGLFIAYGYQFSLVDHDLYATHLLANGTFSTAALNTNPQIQQDPVISPDGSGGFYMAYEDNAAGNYDIKAARVNSSLALLFNGRIITDAPGDQQSPQIVTSGAGAYVYYTDCRFGSYCQVLYDYVQAGGQVGYDLGFSLYSSTDSQGLLSLTPDNSGGYFVTWLDARPSAPGVYLTHMISASTPYSGWPAGGLNVAAGPIYVSWIVGVTPDANNGAFIVWSGGYTPSGAIFGAHYDAFGTAKPLTSLSGRLLYQSTGVGQGMGLTPDAQGGAFMTFYSYALGRGQIYAQHLDPYMTLGDASPSSAGIKDIKADQGGHVRVTWNPSWLDNSQDYGVGSYWIWRQAPITLAQKAARSHSAALFRPATDAGASYAWEFLAQQPANQSAQYSYVAPTTTDSITGHNPYTVFMVEAHAASDSRAYWQSAPDSGYSVDNLAPVTPAPFLGTYAAGNTTMNWGPNAESDLYGYRLYRGSTLGFTPTPGNLVAALSSTAYFDPGVPPSVYKLTAIDVHGNESPPATLVPQGVTAVDLDLPRELSFALASANPSRGAASLRLALPRGTSVSLAIYDVSGRRVRTLADGALAAGVHTLAWDGRDAAGEPAPSGVYLARMSAEGRTFVARIVRAR